MPKNRTVLLVGLLVAAVLLVIYALVLYPQQQQKDLRLQREVRELEDAAQAAQQQLTHIQRAMARLLEDSVPAYSRADKAWGTRLPELILGIDAWVRRSNVVLSKLEPEAAEERPPLVLHPFIVDVTGNFWEICGFLNGLEQELGLVPVLWSVDADIKSGGSLKATCKVVAYEWIGEALNLPLKEEGTVRGLASATARDPFTRGKEMSAPPGARSRFSSMALTGIVSFGDSRKAIIDGKPQGVGDVVGGKRILSITADEVVMEGEPRPLRIDRPLKVVSPAAGNPAEAPGKE